MDWFSWRIAVAFVRETLALPTAPPLTVMAVSSCEARTRWRWLGVQATHRGLFSSGLSTAEKAPCSGIRA